MTRVADDDGTVLDATFSVDDRPLSLVYESAGGRTGVNARNRDYGRGLPLVLRRLAEAGATVTEIRVDSIVTRRLSPDQQRITLRRHEMPLRLSSVNDIDDLKRDISTAARRPGARVGARSGGSSRRLRFLLIAEGSTAEQLDRSVEGAGAIPEVGVVRDVIDIAAGRSSARSQGFLLSPVIKDAVEKHAMARATAHYSQGWTVKDVHKDHSYDLECRRGNEVLYVEVKGTTSKGETVLVTRSEVGIAKQRHPNTELFLVSGIRIDDATAERPTASGGEVSVYRGWAADDSRLRPLGFEYLTGVLERE
jgi:hypothetical protein